MFQKFLNIWHWLFHNPIVFLMYLIVIVLLVLLPLNNSGELNNMNIITFRADYFFHSLLFFPWAFFSVLLNRNVLWWLIIGLIFASLCEAIQYPLPYRAWNINDMLANIFGIFIGFAVLLVFSRRHTQISKT